ncbi:MULTISPECIES: response regulator transcription factor [Kosakonia]|uniref:Two-component system, NarL family, captular synthesis response regulator RcsB n=1 Tax=Kosakonia radicincitans TaxID=283686 RepID=A0AAX2ELF0_9ENTR|nr:MULTISPECIES: response regulator transcription factor [Kosakonia]MDP9565151.1 two-component system capsular synthesis response regulator RcsB [Kosakonia oryzae]SEL19982.1 two component transcriptional regulator, LuxR family [Kosakonia sacchari]APG16831.1 DNA-binding response regulator [Kosakonia radicincitans]ARD62199.1 DNA-binding response regulator [Kosakonia radicincitans DSM 16656]KDE36017.1 LuxR family transcriptional regulator [Kosakonia radicincitans UMEnt01/12]
MSINILIADEHTIIRRGMTSMINSLKTSNINTDKLDIDVVGDTSEQAELLNILATQKVDLLFLGYGLTTVKTGNPVSELDGIALVKWISSRYLKTKIIVLSPYNNTNLVRIVLEAGAKGYISRNTSERTLWRAITNVMMDEVYIERGLMDSLFRREAITPQELSTRESEVLRLLCRGLSLTTISTRMNISIKTVSAHKLRAMGKLNVRTDCQLYCLLFQTRMFDIAM